MLRSKFNELFVLWVLWAGSCSFQWFLESSTKVLWHFTVIHHYLKQSKLGIQIQFLSWMCLCRAHVLWMKWFVLLITASHPFPPVWHPDKHSPSGICSFYPPLPVSFSSHILSAVLNSSGSFSSSCPCFLFSSFPPSLGCRVPHLLLVFLSHYQPLGSLPAGVSVLRSKILQRKCIGELNDAIDRCHRWLWGILGCNSATKRACRVLLNWPRVCMCAQSLTAGWQVWEGHLRKLSSLCKGQTLGLHKSAAHMYSYCFWVMTCKHIVITHWRVEGKSLSKRETESFGLCSLHKQKSWSEIWPIKIKLHRYVWLLLSLTGWCQKSFKGPENSSASFYDQCGCVWMHNCLPQLSVWDLGDL